ncbi:MAG: periplasmic sensor hybrid histidine kinase [Myxococcaceae bacterium]|nr:periplasmic sensor hybrid histidine kinase [Myxococcaceae bacterium]
MEFSSATLDLFVELADADSRSRIATELARRAGAEALYVFVPDRELGSTLVPAPGFAPSVPGGRGWRELLRRCAAGTSRVERAEVAYPHPELRAPALALKHTGLILVLVGGTPDADGEVGRAAAVVAPLLAAMLGAEARELIAAGNLKVSREASRQAGSLATTLDRTRGELERQAESLRAARARAEHASRVKDEFLAMLGHELRNPLSPIVTALHLLRRKGTVSRELEVIGRQVDHLTRLVDDLLDVARITQGKIELRNERVSIADVAQRAIEMASPLFERKRQRLVVNGDLAALHVVADPARLAQVVSNLLTNASRYSPEEACITVSAARADNLARLSVRDEGRGIEPGMTEAIFESFVQAKQSVDRRTGGLGLGLAIVRSLVTMLGGRVWAESAGINLGSEFVVELPLCDSAVNAPGASADNLTLRPGTQRARIMVVDDNEDAAELLSESLRRAGHDICTAHDAHAALELARRFEPRIVLLDIGLPVMDGYELAQELHALFSSRPLHLFAITGYGQPADRERALASGFSDHFVKPVSVADVLQAVLKVLP